MSYHKMASQKEWEELSFEMQTLILALMRAVGGGFLGAFFSVLILQWYFVKTQESWIAITILVAGLATTLGTLYAVILVRTKTKGRPPIGLVLLFVMFLIIGCIFNLLGI